MKIKKIICLILFITCYQFKCFAQSPFSSSKNKLKVLPNIIIIYADDVGFGDISANGAKKINTPNIDKIAKEGLRFTNAYATSSTCTPSRFSLLTGKYAWRQKGTDIAKGDAPLIIPLNTLTLPALLEQAGYYTGIVGKWHLGLGGKEGPDWNGNLMPGPLEVGFNYSFIIPATLDRVPCVFVENHKILNLDPHDPIKVSYTVPVGNEPTGLSRPDLLTMEPSLGHNQTIINGISRIGYMSGGKSARWNDELVGDVLNGRATSFIRQNVTRTFFLYYAVHGIHVPRVPNPKFVNKSSMGPRGDAILELDDMVGKIEKLLDSLNLTKKTILIFSSDNGPVLDDGYRDKAVELLHGHTPGGKMRGGKYSAYDAGTRIPFLISWPNYIAKGNVTEAKFSQIDLYSSFAALIGQQIPKDQAPDSYNLKYVLTGKSHNGRKYIIQQSLNSAFSIIVGNYKYIEPHEGPAIDKNSNIELGNSLNPQLYNLSTDIGEKRNLALLYPTLVKRLARQLEKITKNK